MAFLGFVMGWGEPSLLKRPVSHFLTALLQPQNRQIMSELECCKNVVTIYLKVEVYILRELSKQQCLVQGLGTSLGQRES